MGYVYRYTDLSDDIIKYVGIVWSGNRTLNQRLCEHEKLDDWCSKRRWKIEYISIGINTRTDAEHFESHYISLYETDKYFNIKKSGWGVSSFLPNKEKEWKEYEVDYDNEFIYLAKVKQKMMSEIEDLKCKKEEMKKELNKLYDLKYMELSNKKGNCIMPYLLDDIVIDNFEVSRKPKNKKIRWKDIKGERYFVAKDILEALGRNTCAKSFLNNRHISVTKVYTNSNKSKSILLLTLDNIRDLVKLENKNNNSEEIFDMLTAC